MAGPRNYKAGTKEALALLSQGYCYFPECIEPVLRFVEGYPILNVEVAHIHAANPDGPFYDSSMSDVDRAHFDNLILLCKPHHTLVDKREPAAYLPEDRRRWKQDRESGIGDMLRAVDETRLAEMIEAAVTANPPQAVVAMELACGPLIGTQVASIPLPATKTVLSANPHLGDSPLVLVATARNKGQLPVDITSWDFSCGGEDGFAFGLAGANHYGLLNPQLPIRLEVGSAASWLWRIDVVEKYVRAAFDAPGLSVYELRVTAHLGTGDQAHSDPVSFEHFPWWSDSDAVAAEIARRKGT
jgi:hypothetical protein